MLDGGLAQLGEHLPYKQEVTGSSPVSSIESLAQLVEHLTVNQVVVSSSLTAGANGVNKAPIFIKKDKNILAKSKER